MSQQSGDGQQRHPLVEQMCGASMAQHVGMALLRGDAARFGHSFHASVNTAHVEPFHRSVRPYAEQQCRSFQSDAGEKRCVIHMGTEMLQEAKGATAHRLGAHRQPQATFEKLCADWQPRRDGTPLTAECKQL